MKTESGKAYALRAPFYSPFLGGGLLTALVPVLVIKYSALTVGIGALILAIVLIIVSKSLGLYNKPASVGKSEVINNEIELSYNEVLK